MSDLIQIVEFMGRAVWGVWPAFLVSVLLGVLVRALKLDGAIRHAFSARIGVAILLATAVGAFSPFCSCTVVPVVSGLLLSGVPLAPVMAFWVASPTMDPEIFALSVATLGWPLAVARLAATLVMSVGAGYLTLALTQSGFLSGALLRQKRAGVAATPVPPITQTPILAPNTFAVAGVGYAQAIPVASIPVASIPIASNAAAGGCGAGGCSVQPSAPVVEARWWQGVADSARALDWREVGRDVAAQGWSLGRWLLLAFFMEALITLYVPQTTIAGFLGQNNPLAVPLAALVGVPLYLNNVSALPIVSGLLAQGMQPGAAIAFLIAGPVTTIPAMTAVWGVVGRRVFALYLGVGLFGSILAGVVTNLVF